MIKKPVFSAYENIWERIFLLSSSCYLILFLFAVMGILWHNQTLTLGRFYLVVGAAAVIFFKLCQYALAARVKVYTDGIKIMGYPFFKWENLSRVKFSKLQNARPVLLAPDAELEILSREGFRWRSSWWRRAFLREEFSQRIMVPFWSLSNLGRTRLLQEIGKYLALPQLPAFPPETKTRLFLRRLFFITADILILIILILMIYAGFLFFGDILYLG